MRKKFIVYYRIDSTYSAQIVAESLTDALEKAKEMSAEELQNKPGDVLDKIVIITGVSE